MQNKCKFCNKVFESPSTQKRKFCSLECSHKHQSKVRKNIPRKGNYPKAKFIEYYCRTCGKLTKKPNWKNHMKYKYCSTQCRSKSLVPKTIGKKRVNKEGYEQIFLPCHPFTNSGFMLFHRYIVEYFLKKNNPDSEYLIKLGNNKYLNPKLIIHHINLNKLDNFVSNLYIFKTSKEHINSHYNKKQLVSNVIF